MDGSVPVAQEQGTLQDTRAASSPSALMLRSLLGNVSGMAGAVIFVIVILATLVGPLLLSTDPSRPDLGNRLSSPSAEHWFGTDELGRDIFARVIHGGRISLTITLSAVAIGLSIGAILGVAAGFRLGLWEVIIMRGVDVMLALPGFLLALLTITILGPGIFNLILALALYSIPTFARIAHATTLSVREMDYVEAARALGAKDSRIMFRTIVPNAMSPILVQGTIRLATALLLASSLSFLGLGVEPPKPEWGAMLAGGRAYISSGPHAVLFPGLAIMLATLSFNLLGDALRDIIDPRYRKG